MKKNNGWTWEEINSEEEEWLNFVWDLEISIWNGYHFICFCQNIKLGWGTTKLQR